MYNDKLDHKDTIFKKETVIQILLTLNIILVKLKLIMLYNQPRNNIFL